MPRWTPATMPDQDGRVVVITGSSSGIGAEAADVLAGRGAQVVLAVRSQSRGDAVAARIRARHAQARVTVSLLDTADLASVREFARRTADTVPQVDVLLNNAGLGLQRARAVTADGFERQFGTNHLGHFALTGLLMPVLLKAAAPRVVAISSIAHRRGRIDFDDLQGERRYDGSKAYSQSKLANLMFAFELDRRARAAGWHLLSVAAHPGVATTGFVAAIGLPRVAVAVINAGIGVFGQDAARGALPGLYAATMPDVKGGQYWGPDGFREIKGDPALAVLSPQALDQAAWQRLWTVSEQLTGVRYPAVS